MRARLDALGVDGRRARARSTRPRSRSCTASRRSSIGADPPVEGAAAAPDRRTRCPAPYKFRPVGDLATEIEWAKNRRIPPGDVPRARSATTSRRSRADLMHAGLPRLRAAQGASRATSTSRTCSSWRSGSSTPTSGALEQRPRPLPGVHRRRVPGRQPAPADAARPLARRARRPLRRRRRLPVDLRLHRRVARSTCSRCRRGFRARPSSGSRRTTARRPRCSSSRTGSCRGSAAPRRCCARRCRTGPSPSARSFAQRRAEAAFIVERMRELHDGGTPLRGDRGPLPDERALGRLRGGAARGAASRSRARSFLARDAARRALLRRYAVAGGSAAEVRRVALDRGCSRSLPDKLGEREVTRQADLARLVRLAEEFDEGTVAEFVARARGTLRQRRRPGRPPAHLPPGEGSRVRRRLPAAPRGAGAAVASSRRRRPRSPRSDGSSTSG